ncbi:uncharacterized protein LOC126779832, partial [Nymphalis io]|uniref:uncharacterized protein LOC126779832 n=1 Tax=Inachis io TaxID=171585 RepID=UPI002169820D
ITLRYYATGSYQNVIGDIFHGEIKLKGFGTEKRFFIKCTNGTAKLCNWNVTAKWPGSVDNSTIFNDSPLCAQFERCDANFVLLGDSGYPCRHYFLTPFS